MEGFDVHKPLSDDLKSQIKDMLRSTAWKYFEALVEDGCKNNRLQATQRQTELNDRLWFSAVAEGREQPLLEISDKIK